MTNKLRIMLVDDHAVLRAGIKLMVNSQEDMEVVAEADNIVDALRLVALESPNVIVLDLSLPGGASLPSIEKMVGHEQKTHVLVLTMHDDPAYVRSALSSGATGYVVKKIGEIELLAAIRSVARGKLVVDLDDEDLTIQVFQTLRPGFAKDLSIAPLSAREKEVLRLLSQGFTNQAIATSLDISPKTVATYRSRIGEKLGLHTTADFVKYAADTGLLKSEN